VTPGQVIEHPNVTAQRDVRDLTIIKLAMQVLGEKVYHWATLLLVAGAFAWVIAKPEPWRLGAVVAFTFLTHVPLWWERLRAQKYASKRAA
jgi:hypothetical protein